MATPTRTVGSAGHRTFAPGHQIELRFTTFMLTSLVTLFTYPYGWRSQTTAILLCHSVIFEFLILVYCHRLERHYAPKVVLAIDIWVLACLIAAISVNWYPFAVSLRSFGNSLGALLLTIDTVLVYTSFVSLYRPSQDPRRAWRQLMDGPLKPPNAQLIPAPAEGEPTAIPAPSVPLVDATTAPPYAPGIQIEPRILLLLSYLALFILSSDNDFLIPIPASAVLLVLLLTGHLIEGSYKPLLVACLDLAIFVGWPISLALVIVGRDGYGRGYYGPVREGWRTLGLGIVSVVGILLSLVLWLVSAWAVFRPLEDERPGIVQIFVRRGVRLGEEDDGEQDRGE